MIPSSSRNHCTTAPAINILPSRAYCVLPSICQAMVVSRLLVDSIGLSPVFMIIKQPVPYVFLTIPDSMHLCPNRADCWSPAIPAIGTFVPNVSAFVSPYTSLEDLDRKSTRLNSSHVAISYAV